MKSKNWWSVFLMVCLLAGLSSQAAAAWWGREKPRKTIARRLELTVEQQKKFEAVEEETKREMKASQEKIKEIGEKLKAELEKDAPDRNAVHRHIRELSRVRTEMQIKRMDSMLKLRETLTPQQREKFKHMVDSRRPPRGKR